MFDTSIVPRILGPPSVSTCGRNTLSRFSSASLSTFGSLFSGSTATLSTTGMLSTTGSTLTSGWGLGSAFGSGLGSALGSGLGSAFLPSRSILPKILGPRTSSLTLMTLLFTTTTSSSSLCSCELMLTAPFCCMRSRIALRSFPDWRLRPNSFSKAAYTSADTGEDGEQSLCRPLRCKKSARVLKPTLNSLATCISLIFLLLSIYISFRLLIVINLRVARRGMRPTKKSFSLMLALKMLIYA